MSNKESNEEESVYDRPKCIEELFHQAVVEGNLTIIKEMVKQGVDVCWTDPMGWSALHLASRERNLDIVKFLVDQNAEVNALGLKDWTALHYACHSGIDETIKFLVESGADKSLMTIDGRAPRDMCITWAMKKYLYDCPEYQVEYERWLYAEKYHSELDAMEELEKLEWDKLKKKIDEDRAAKAAAEAAVDSRE